MFVKIYENNENNEFFVIFVYSKFVESRYNIQFDEIFTILYFNQKFSINEIKYRLRFIM